MKGDSNGGNKVKMLYRLKNRNFWIMFLGDIVLVALAYFLAYYLRFDGNIPAREISNWVNTVTWIVPLKLVCFLFFGLYKGMWRYTGVYDLENLIKACIASSAIIVSVLAIWVRFVMKRDALQFLNFPVVFGTDYADYTDQ